MKNIIRFKKFLESKSPKFPDIKSFEQGGYQILLGRDAKSNDYLTFILAQEEDLWMHVKGQPGSHVVIKMLGQEAFGLCQLPTPEIIKWAAQLAKKNSKAKNDPLATVVYCKRKFVKKDSQMNEGQVRVDYVNAQEMNIGI